MERPALRSEIRFQLPLASDYFIDELTKFELLMEPFFPHLKGNHSEFGFEMEWLWQSSQHSSVEISSHSKALRELEELERSLRYLVNYDFSYFLTLAAQGSPGEKDNISFFLDFIGTLNRSVNESDENFQGNELILSFIRECKNAILRTVEKANTNWPAVLAVDSLRTLWWRNTGRTKEPPIYLNPATRFYLFVEAGFEYLEVSGNVMAAFRSWRRHVS